VDFGKTKLLRIPRKREHVSIIVCMSKPAVTKAGSVADFISGGLKNNQFLNAILWSYYKFLKIYHRRRRQLQKTKRLEKYQAPSF
jgi:hypothetical protein